VEFLRLHRYDCTEKSDPGPALPRDFRGNVFTVSLRHATQGNNLSGGYKMKRFMSVMFFLLFAAMGVSAVAQDSPEALYKAKCAACHGPDGTGATAAGTKLGAKDFHSPAVTAMSDGDLADITKNGKEKMPAYGKSLTDDQIKSLVKYVRTLKP
jgi:cytochrome c5